MPAEASFSLEERHLQTLLDDGLQRARQQRRPVLVTIVRRVPWADPLEFFEWGVGVAADRMYWECPSEGYSMVGVGAASTLSVYGPHRFADAAAAWQDCCADAIIDGEAGIEGTGPVLMGGFAFDPLRASSTRWAGYPDGRLVLPRHVLTTTDGATWLTINALLSPDCDLAAEAQAIMGVRGWWMRIGSTAPPPPSTDPLVVEDVLPAAEWMAIVRTLVEDLRRGDLEKVVLARECRVSARQPVEVPRVLSRLRAEYPSCFIFAIARGTRCFLGASPERLVRMRQGTVWATCLAGSIARGATEDEDLQLGAALLASVKDRAEHAIVVRALHDALVNMCEAPASPSTPTLMKMHNVQHLFTPVTGRVINGRTILDLVEQIHPTPAVGGYPRDAALRLIRECEQLDRGWYGGPVGWLDARGQGEFAVAIRSALLRESDASLFAGCGIIADSDPESEYAESCLKLRPILSALDGSGG